MTTETPPLTVVFDLDGTLVETAGDLVGALTATLKREGVAPLAFDQARDLIGSGARALVERGLRVANHVVSLEKLDSMHRYFLEVYAEHIAEESAPYPGCAETLDRLAARGVKLAVCTNKMEGLAVRLLDAVDLTRRFGAIVGGDTFAVNKPNAEPLLGAIERVGGDRRRAVMVGDSQTDVGAARAAGVPIVITTFGYTLTPARELDGDAFIDHFDEFEDALATLGFPA